MSEVKYSNRPQLANGCNRATTMTQITGTRLASAGRPLHATLPLPGSFKNAILIRSWNPCKIWNLSSKIQLENRRDLFTVIIAAKGSSGEHSFKIIAALKPSCAFFFSFNSLQPKDQKLNIVKFSRGNWRLTQQIKNVLKAQNFRTVPSLLTCGPWNKYFIHKFCWSKKKQFEKKKCTMIKTLQHLMWQIAGCMAPVISTVW